MEGQAEEAALRDREGVVAGVAISSREVIRDIEEVVAVAEIIGPSVPYVSAWSPSSEPQSSRPVADQLIEGSLGTNQLLQREDERGYVRIGKCPANFEVGRSGIVLNLHTDDRAAGRRRASIETVLALVGEKMKRV